MITSSDLEFLALMLGLIASILAIYHSISNILREIDEQTKKLDKAVEKKTGALLRVFKRRRKTRMSRVPGSKLMPLVRLCYSAKSVDKIFEPIYADFCEEYFAALAVGHKGHARWIRVRYYKDFVKAVSLFGVVRLAKTVFEYWEKIA